MKNIIFVFGMMVFIMLAISLSSKKVFAVPLISNVAPIPASGALTGNNSATTQPWFAVGTGAFDGAVSYAKIYVPNSTTTLTIQNGGGVCGIDVASPNVTYTVYSLDPGSANGGYEAYNIGPNVGIVGNRSNQTSGCGNLTIPISGGNQSVVPGHEGYKIFYFEAKILASIGDNEKNFRLSVSNGAFVGVSAFVLGNGAKPWFGVYQRDAPSYGGNNWNWSINFGPHCNEDTTVTLRKVQIYDIDWQVYNQPFLLAAVKQDSRTNPGTNWSPATTYPGSPDPTSRYQNGFSSGSHTENDLGYSSTVDNRYGVFFQDIDWHNTLQIAVPYDQFDGSPNVKCASPYVATCSINIGDQTGLAPNTSKTFTVTATNGGASSWDPSATPTIRLERKVFLNGANTFTTYHDLGSANLSGNPVPKGGTAKYTFTETSPASAGSKTFQFRMQRQAVGYMTGTNFCKVTLTTGSGGGGSPTPDGGIQAACGTSNVYVNNITATYGAAATRITRVPAVIIITDNNPQPGDPPPFSFIVQATDGSYGIPNNSSATVNTFGMWNRMYPHRSYTLQLYVQGKSGVNSPTYTDNGHWNPTNDATQTGYYYNDITSIGLPVTIGGDECFDASCTAPTSVESEPGQTKNYSYGIQVTNNSARQYSPNDSANGYSFSVGTRGGFANVVQSATTPDPIGAQSTNNLSVNFRARLDFTGTFWIVMNFRGQPIGDLASLPGGDCGNGNTGQPGNPTPNAKPFFEVRGGDISVGGGYASPSGSCADTAAGDSPYISPTVTGYPYSGGIRSFASQSSARGSVSQFGAYTLGLTIGTINGPIGFYSANDGFFADQSSPDFPSIGSLGQSGYLNSSPPAHCQADFFTAKQKNLGSTPTFNGDLNATTTGQYINNGDLVINGATINRGKQITLFVDGNVTINGNIKYDTDWDPNNQADVPYLVLIVRGNITLDNNVTQLDGLYIAQPTGSSNGEFSSCDTTKFCNNALTVNGAIIAQQVNLLRAHGTLSDPTLDADINDICTPFGASNCPPAEVVNYVPSMVIGLPELLEESDGALIPTGVDGIFSLPPVF